MTIGFLHSFPGYNTTSSFIGKGKNTIGRSLLDDKNVSSLTDVYYKKDEDKE